MIDYTKPASGSILYPENFTSLKVKLLRPIDKATFSVADDVRLFEIRNFWQSDRQEIPYPGGATAVLSQAPWACPGESCDQIDLVVNSTMIEPLLHYRIRILGLEPANGDDPQTPLSTPAGDGEVALAHDVDIIVGVGLFSESITPPYLIGVATLYLLPQECMDRSSAIFNTPACIVDPHTNLMIGFSALMGYIFFNVEPLYGFNFKQEVERMSIKDITVLYSDSIQGFSPGMRYVMDFPAEEPPEGMGIPRTTDRYGNHLDKSYHFEFNTAHVRIILPAHEPCFYLRCPPDLWYKLSSPDDPWFAVEATPRVRRLSATGPDGNTAEVVFEDLSIPSGRTENSFHTIYPTEVPGSPGCPTTIEVHAYGAAGEYLGKDRLRVYAYPPPESIRIVTYNAHNNKSDAGFSWRGRFDNFVRHIVVRYQPAIIAVQEVMLDIEGLDGCEDMSKGEYLHYLVDGINQAIGRSGLECGKYHLATAVRSGFWPWNVTFPCDRWQGEAIIYDSQQVRLIYPQPRSGAPEFRGCTEWSEGQEDLYEFFVPRDLHNDCMTNHGWGEDGDNALVSRAVFEFPLHSNRYFSFYNVQHAIPPCAIPATITDYILDRQNTFREDLAGYLLDEVRARRPFSIYPPIYAGDMNTREPGDQTGWEWMDRCNLPAEQRQLVQDSFFDAPSPGPIDKVWVGTTDFWNHEVGWKIMQPPSHMDPAQMSERQCREEWYPPFSCFALGYYVVGEDNVYSDHSPSMVEVEPSGQ